MFSLLVVLVKLSVLAKWLAKKTPLRKPNHGKGIVSRKPRPKSAHDFLGLLYCFIVLLCICVVYCPYVTYFPTVMACASGCVVECRTCKREVAGLNIGQGFFAPRYTQPSIPPGWVKEYQLRLGRQRQVWLIPLAYETQGVQVKLWYPLTMRAIPVHFRDVSCIGAEQIDITFTLPLAAFVAGRNKCIKNHCTEVTLQHT